MKSAAALHAKIENKRHEIEERAARELLAAITDDELQTLICELEGGASRTPIEELARLVGPMDNSLRRRAQCIFDGQPALLQRCRERVAARRAASAR